MESVYKGIFGSILRSLILHIFLQQLERISPHHLFRTLVFSQRPLRIYLLSWLAEQLPRSIMSTYDLYPYEPSLALAIVFAVFIGISLLIHIYQNLYVHP